MRNLDNTLNGDLNDNISAYTTGSVTSLLPTSSINENETYYDLLPVVINQPPIINVPISNASRPTIKSSNSADASGQNLYQFPDGTVKVMQDVTFELRIGAVQPNTFNVENGIPIIKQADQELTYVWRQDDTMIRSDEKKSLQSRITVTNNVIRFERIQPSSAGTYTCEISNDIGAVISEPITIEVLNPDLDAFFYRNLVVNGNATTGTSAWEGDTDIMTAREMTKRDTVELKAPHRVDLFGYNVDMMHPRPYQMEVGVVKGINYEEDFINKNGKGGYFSRDVYKFEKAGGSFFVKTYQDIDVTPIQDLVKGSVYGIDGVRAVFGCYIGNAISQYVPTIETVLLHQKTNPGNYFMGAPRVSLENFLTAGPGFTVDRCYVTLEEYDKESRLISTILRPNGTSYREPNTITLMDPWTKRISKYYGEKYYKTDIYKLGSTSLGNGYDATLFTADELYPNPKDRPTHSQYLEFNRLVLERLNPKTTKVRINLNFYTNDWRIFDSVDYEKTNSDQIFETIGWEKNYKKGTFEQKGSGTSEVDFIRSFVSNNPTYRDKPITEQVPLAPTPRLAITGLSLSLIPIQRQKADSTNYYTSATFSTNNRPQVSVPSALDPSAIFDPSGIRKKNMFVYFQHKSEPKGRFIEGVFLQTNTTAIVLKTQSPGKDATPIKFVASSPSIFPFVLNDRVSAYNLTQTNFEFTIARIEDDIKPYRSLVYNNPSGSQSTASAIAIANAINPLNGPIITINSDFTPPPEPAVNKSATWKNRFRYVLHYMVRESGSLDASSPTLDSGRSSNLYYLLVDLNSTRPVIIYKDGALPGGSDTDLEFEVTDYRINPYGEFEYDLPMSLLTTSVSRGGLGIPTIDNYTMSASAITSLDFLKNISKYPSASLSANIDILYNSYAASRPAQDETTQQLQKIQFTSDIIEHVSIPGSLIVTLEDLKVKYQIDTINTTIATGLKIPNPKYTTSLYAVNMAPQIGPNFNGSPVQGKDVDGTSYAISYPRIVDTQTAL
jgi:hypothetical protein